MTDAKQILLRLVAEGKTRETLSKLSEWAPREDTGLREEIILLFARYERWEKDVRQESIDQEEQNVQISRISASLLQLIEKLPENHPAWRPGYGRLGRRLWIATGGVALLAIVFLVFGKQAGIFQGQTGEGPEEWEEPLYSMEFIHPDSLTDIPCLTAELADRPEVRTLRLEEGALSRPLIGRNIEKEKPVCIVFTQDGQTIGAIIFSFFPKEEIFKIAKIVDKNCAPVQDLQVVGRPGESRTLQNWDTIRFGIGTNHYVLRLGYDGISIDAGEFHLVS